MIILTNEDVRQILTIEDTIEALRISNREVYEFRRSRDFQLNRARTNCYLPWSADLLQAGEQMPGKGEGSVVYNFKSMEGGSPHFGVWALRSSSDLVRHQDGHYGPTHTYLRYGDLPGGKGYSDLVFLYNLVDAQFEAIIHSAELQRMRVAATSALGVDSLCRADVDKLGLFGSGWQAAANLRAIKVVRPGINSVSVFSPDAERRSEFSKRMSRELQIDVVPVPKPESAVMGMDVICEATSARSPVFDGAWLRSGQHVVSVGGGDESFHRRPIDPKAVSRSDHVVAHSLEVRFGLEEIEDCVAAGDKTWDEIVDLPELIAGDSLPPITPDAITFFKNNVGLGTQFAAVGGWVLRRAKEQKMGHEVPGDLVSQKMSR